MRFHCLTGLLTTQCGTSIWGGAESGKRGACCVMPLRSPNGTKVAGLLAEGVRKVIENLDQMEI